MLLIKDSYSTEEAIEARFQGILLLLGALLLLMGGSVAEAARAAQMFTIFLTLFIPRVVSLSKYGNIFGGLCLLVLIMYYYTQLAANSAEVIPYTTFFS